MPLALVDGIGAVRRQPHRRRIPAPWPAVGPRLRLSGIEARPELADLLGAVARERDRKAFRVLFEHFGPRLKSYVLRQGADEATAEEVVQETMVRLWHKAAQFDATKASAATWMFTIARNVRIDMLRRSRRPEFGVDDLPEIVDSAPHPADAIARDQDARRLREAVSALSVEHQAVLHLAFFEDKPHPVIARVLGLPLGTVKSRIRLAMKRIRSQLGVEE